MQLFNRSNGKCGIMYMYVNCSLLTAHMAHAPGVYPGFLTCVAQPQH